MENSQIPAAVRDKASPAYNGGNTQIDRSSLATKEAYAEQAKKDLDSFLAARAHEIGPGGLLFLVFLTRPDEQSGAILLEDGEEDVWDSMVLEVKCMTNSRQICPHLLVYFDH